MKNQICNTTTARIWCVWCGS